MGKNTKKTRSANFVVFRTIESLVFVAPILVAFFYDLPTFILVLLISGTLYALWTRYFKRSLSNEEVESYEAVYDENNKTRVYRLADLSPPWTMWVVWISVIIYSIFLM